LGQSVLNANIQNAEQPNDSQICGPQQSRPTEEVEDWFYVPDGVQRVPTTLKELTSLFADGRLKPTDLVWHPRLGQNWLEAQAVPELAPARMKVAASEDRQDAHGNIRRDASKTGSPRRWYYSLDGSSRYGPFTSAELKELVRTSRLPRTGRVSRDGKTWHAASQLQGVEWPS